MSIAGILSYLGRKILLYFRGKKLNLRALLLLLGSTYVMKRAVGSM